MPQGGHCVKDTDFTDSNIIESVFIREPFVCALGGR